LLASFVIPPRFGATAASKITPGRPIGREHAMGRLLARIGLQYQIGLIGLGGLIGLCVFGALYYSGTLAQRTYQDTADRTAGYEEAITAIDRAIAEAGRSEMAFLLWHKAEDAAQQDKYARQVSDRLERMEAGLRQDGADSLADRAAKIRVGFAGYVSQFITVTQLNQSVGLNEESGLLGRLRNAVHEAEASLHKVDDPNLLVSMLMMRRHEKDFLARHGEGKGEKYLADMKQSEEKFDAALAASPLAEDARAAIADRMTAYQRDFFVMADAILELDGEIQKLTKKRLAIEPLIADTTATVTRMYQDASAAMAASRARTSARLAWSFAAVALLLVIGAGAIGWSIARPITLVVAVMERLARGDHAIDILYTDRRDEVGAMARSVQVFKDHAAEIERMRADQETQRRAAEGEKKRAMAALADTFEASISAIVDAVSAAAAEMQRTAQAMSGTAEQTKQQSLSVAASSRQTTTNVQGAATAADELSASIAEIGRQVAQATGVASRAADEGRRTDTSVQGLAEAVQQIGEVVALINDIASQTNLLALNATIEAARAGEAGNGFAVVAGEVKSLANQTAKATDDIRAQIGAIQGATAAAVAAIRGICGTILEVSTISASIAAAVEEQSAATQEIARNVQQVAAGTEDVSKTIADVTAATGETGTAAREVLWAAAQLSEQAERLRQQVGHFLATVRAA
jgi:methyl-accepting chemotaxis protein